MGWRDDHRFAYILAALGDKRKPYEMFSSLKAVERDRQLFEEEQSGAQKLVSSGFLNKLVADTGWDVEVKL